MIRCPNCGEVNEPGSRFCFNCGADLSALQPEASPAPEQQPDQAEQQREQTFPPQYQPPAPPPPSLSRQSLPPQYQPPSSWSGGQQQQPSWAPPPGQPSGWAAMDRLDPPPPPKRRPAWLMVILGIIAGCLLVCVGTFVFALTPAGQDTFEDLGTVAAEFATEAAPEPTREP